LAQSPHQAGQAEQVHPSGKAGQPHRLVGSQRHQFENRFPALAMNGRAVGTQEILVSQAGLEKRWPIRRPSPIAGACI